MSEEWRPIPGHDGYWASSLGRIRSKRCLLSPAIHSSAHPYRYVRVNGRGRRNTAVHTLVALAFIGPRPSGHYVCHQDGDPSNNRPENLYYGSPKENQADRHRHGTARIGVKHPMSKLTEQQLAEVRRRLELGEKQREMAEAFGVSQSAVSMIKNGRRHANGR